MNPPASATTRLTDEQTRPLTVAGASVALTAGAGCGKTTVLTARYLGRLEGAGEHPLRATVALTFTRKAARELRQRIRDRCHEHLSTGIDAPRWRSLLRAIEAAPIGTFHEFCADWLRRHAAAAGIDPEFTVLDESIAGTLRAEALARCLRNWLAQAEPEPDLVELAVEFGLAWVRRALDDLGADRSVAELDAWAERSPAEIVAIWQREWEASGRITLFQKTARAARRCRELLSVHESTHPRMRERCALLLEHLPAFEHAPVADERLQAVSENARVQGGGKKDHWSTPAVYEQIRKQFDVLRDEIKAYRAASQWDETTSLAAAEHGRRLARLVVTFRQVYDAAKRARGGFDFDDLQILTRDLMSRTPELSQEIVQDLLTHFLVDEFQDTDPVQARILEQLGGPTLAAGRLFLVGDEKQSIYRFRGAQPRIFREFRTRFPAAGHLALTENFRSVPPILDFVNALFGEAFDEGESRLVPGAKVYPPVPDAAIEFLWARESEEEAAEEEPDVERAGSFAARKRTRPLVKDQRKTEAQWIARRLRQRLDAGWRVRDRSGNLRRAGPGDIALLFRAMTSVGFYEAALAEEGFDYHVVGGSAFYAQQEVLDLINVLSAIEDPFDSLALAGALRGPFFCVSDDGLYWLTTARDEGLTDGLANVEQIGALSSDDRGLALRARTLLEHWRALKDQVSIATLVDRVLDETGYEAALLGESLGGRKRANARKLVRMARRFDEQGGFTVADFVARLRADRRKPPREEQAATTDEEGTSIRLMSIHQAKGLEFPIVVIPDLDRKPGAMSDGFALSAELGPLVRLSIEPAPGEEAEAKEGGKSLGWMTYQVLEQLEEKREALRLFYVATTRARDALILSAGVEAGEKPKSPAMALLTERFDRETGRCLAVLPEGWSVPPVLVTSQCPAPRSREQEARPPRVDLKAVASTITTAPAPSDEPLTPAARPRFLDLDPALGLNPALGRLDRLIRAIVTDPRVLDSGALSTIAREVARRQQPAAPPGLVEEALARLQPWFASEPFRILRTADAVERSLSWTVTWPPGDAAGTVFAGTIDLLCRDRDRDWRPLVITVAESSPRHERLRLLLGARAAAGLGFGPVGEGWSVGLGPGGGAEAAGRFARPAIEEAVRALL